MAKQCVLEERLCSDCGDCNQCDLDAAKICDNCMKCVMPANDYAEILIDEIINSDNAKKSL